MSRLDPLSRLLFVGACLLAALAGITILAVLAVCGLFDLCFARDGLTAGFERLQSRRVRLSRTS